MSKFINDLAAQDQAARNAAIMAPYVELALKIAQHTEEVGTVSKAVKEAKGGIWGAFKSAMATASEAGHNASALRLGLALACTEAGMKPGTFRSYVMTVGDIWAEAHDGVLPKGIETAITIEEAAKLSIGDARKRYKVLSQKEQLLADITAKLKEMDESALTDVLLLLSDDAEQDEEMTEQDDDAGTLAATGTEG